MVLDFIEDITLANNGAAEMKRISVLSRFPIWAISFIVIMGLMILVVVGVFSRNNAFPLIVTAFLIAIAVAVFVLY